MVDLLFIATGQICTEGAGCSLSSVIFNALLNIGDISATDLFRELIGSIKDLFSSKTGIFALAATVGVAATGAAIFARTEIILFIPIAATLSIMAGDFVFIASYLASINPLLATFIMAPIIIIYVITLVDWVKGRD